MVKLARLVFHYWWFILLLTLLAGGAGYYVTSTSEDLYQSEAIIYVMIPSSTDTQADLSSSSMISNDIGEYSSSEVLLLNVRDSLAATVPSLRGVSYDDMLRKIEIDVKAQTRIINIKAMDADPKTAALLADKVAATLKAKFLDMLKIDAVQIIEPASVSYEPMDNHATRDTALAALGGLLLAIGFVMFADHIRKDIQADKEARWKVRDEAERVRAEELLRASNPRGLSGGPPTGFVFPPSDPAVYESHVKRADMNEGGA